MFLVTTIRTPLLAVALIASAHAAAAPDVLIDRRASAWKATVVRNVGTGVVQHTGDDTTFGDFAKLLRTRLTSAGVLAADQILEVKTTDVRLSLPNARIDEGAVRAAQSAAPAGQLIAGPVAALLSTFSKDKSASAVFCVSIQERNYLGNDARLFRFGADGELREAVEAAVQRLTAAIRSGTSTQSPACDPGWEGGQPAEATQSTAPNAD